MLALNCPFRTVDRLPEQAQKDCRPKAIVVDSRAEGASEKQALGWYLDGRVSTFVGTHTHVGTVDAGILSNGTGFVTGVGTMWSINSVIGPSLIPY